MITSAIVVTTRNAPGVGPSERIARSGHVPSSIQHMERKNCCATPTINAAIIEIAFTKTSPLPPNSQHQPRTRQAANSRMQIW